VACVVGLFLFHSSASVAGSCASFKDYEILKSNEFCSLHVPSRFPAKAPLLALGVVALVGIVKCLHIFYNCIYPGWHSLASCHSQQ